ncbi:MAG: peptidoglycan-binding protein, partial [Oscillospiraceae bacterium]|nr:peptidoglycan-binding protein [Oscillospiraceae bacterium]
MAKIVIDPGHTGGFNKGVCPGYYEGNAMLKLAKYLGEELTQYGADVIYTRTTDAENPSLIDRGHKGANADLFISLHSNASENSTIRGVDAFYSVRRPESKSFATALGTAAAEAMGTPFRGSSIMLYPNDPTLDYFGVIRYSVEVGAKNSFLIEHGFHTNPLDCAVLNNDAALKRIAAAEAKVIANYFGLSKENQCQCQCAFSYTVRSGDSLYSIGQMFGVLWQNIATANNLSSPYTLQIGQQIAIPFQCVFPYTVRSGDSLFSIGQRFGVPWQDIATANNLLPPYPLQIGQLVIIPINNMRSSQMGAGYLRVEVRTGDDAMPVENARVKVMSKDGKVLYDTTTDASGMTEALSLPAPDKKYTLDPNYEGLAYAIYDVDISADGFVSLHIHDVEILDTQTSILIEQMKPLVDESNPVKDEDIDIAPPAVTLPVQRRQYEKPPQAQSPISAMEMENLNLLGEQVIPATLGGVLIPDYITVHLGIPTNADARNVRVRFIDYVKNVASSEIFATWPRNSLLANIHVIVTFALNRIYTEWYPSRGYPFNITNSTAYDQFYKDGAQIFESISKLVDEYFNTYAHRAGVSSPFFTSFCNGTTSKCDGLSQWGTVTLANEGKTALEILRYYYPKDIVLSISQNIGGITESFPGTALTVGSQGESVRKMQNYLNRIRVNFPSIPIISNPNGVFGTDTANAVRVFQNTFNLTSDGVIGKTTWNKISFIFAGVARLAELDSEGQRYSIGLNPPTTVLTLGSRGADVNELQFILNAISPYYPSIPVLIMDSDFGVSDKNAVIEFQKTFGLTADGIVNSITWNKLYAVYRGIKENAPVEPKPPVELPPSGIPPYPGTPLRVGSTGANVSLMQTYLKTIRMVYPYIPSLTVTGIFSEETKAAVIAFQNFYGLTPDGIIGPATWNKIAEVYRFVTNGTSTSLEYPGTPLRLGSRGTEVKLIQSLLVDLSKRFTSIPTIIPDGVFGPETQAAVIAFQRLFGLSPDGVIGPLTWSRIVSESQAPTEIRYTVQAGDTLFSIGQRFGVPWQDIA